MQDNNNPTEQAIKAYQDKKTEVAGRIADLKNKLREAEAEDRENEASTGAKLAARERTRKGLEAAARVKVRDYMLIEDIPEQAIDIPEDITFGHLIDIALEAADYDGNRKALREYAEDAADWVDDRTNGLDSDAHEKIENRTRWIIDQADNAEIMPIEII